MTAGSKGTGMRVSVRKRTSQNGQFSARCWVSTRFKIALELNFDSAASKLRDGSDELCRTFSYLESGS